MLLRQVLSAILLVQITFAATFNDTKVDTLLKQTPPCILSCLNEPELSRLPIFCSIMWVETTFKAAQSNREALDGVVLPCLRSACSTGELQGFKQLVTENLAPVTESCSAAGQVAVNKTVAAIQEAPACLRSCWSNSKPYTTDKLRELCVQHQAGFPNPVPLNIDTMSTAMSRCPFDVCRKTNATDSDTLLSLLTSATFRDNMNLACGLTVFQEATKPVSTTASLPSSTFIVSSIKTSTTSSGIATRLGCLLLPIPAIII